MIDRSRLGVVSNCWQSQLAEGQPLEHLIGRAVDEFGFRHIELRQGSLGAFEDSDRMPDADALSGLSSQFPQVSFDLAVELPVFAEPVRQNDHLLQHYLEAARALSGHLRIVDLTPCPAFDVTTAWLAMAAANLTSLANEMSDGLVSIEHSIQPWSRFWPAFESARSKCEATLKLCYDPVNLWLTGDGAQADEITRSIPVESLSMVHLKQRCGDSTLPSFTDGNVDWQSQLSILADRNYGGPLLFEIAPSESVWEELAAGLQKLDHLLRQIAER